jgi:hypothetical protein
MGEEWRRYFPLVGTIFAFVLVSNLLGLVPGVGGASSDVNMTTAWAIISFLTYNAIGIHKHGFWYINQFMGPSFFELHLFGRHIHVRALAPLFLPLKLILHWPDLTLRLLLRTCSRSHAVSDIGLFHGILAPAGLACQAVFRPWFQAAEDDLQHRSAPRT